MNRCAHPGCTKTERLHLVRFPGALDPFGRLFCPRHALGWRGARVEPVPAAWGRAA